MKLLFSKVIKSYKISIGSPFIVNENDEVEETVCSPDEDMLIREGTYECDEGGHDTDEIYTKNLIIDAEKRAELIIKEAEKKAAAILEIAEKQKVESIKAAELTKQKGYDEGFSAGYKSGYEQGSKKIEAKYEQELNNIISIKENAIQEYRQLLDGVEADAVNIILDIAKKVIQKELNNKESLLGIIREAFDKCSEEKEAVLCVSAEDYDYLSERLDELRQISGKIIKLDLKRDASLKQGSCVIETSHGAVDTSVEKKMIKIEKAFKAAVGDS